MQDPAATATIDPQLIHGWLAARSLARGLPAPVPDHGGWRVDTGSADEAVRWVFAAPEPGLARLARSIHEPRHVIKLCGEVRDLEAALPAGWRIAPPAHLMQRTGAPSPAPPPPGYRLQLDRAGPVAHAQIISDSGEPAAGGYAASTGGVFIYDRIITAPHHRRRGLGRAVMAALGETWPPGGPAQLLVATDEGRALYTTLGWRTVGAYWTASIPSP